MIKEAINELKKYTLGKKNTEKVEISVLQLNRVIKALEQEPILDKIRAEIEQAKIYILKTEDGKEIKASANDVINPDYRNYTSGLNTALQIIDKYKAERSE